MICLSKGDMMIKEKYKQLFLPLPFGGIRTMNIHNRWHSLKTELRIQELNTINHNLR